jgi:hypothetical protein
VPVFGRSLHVWIAILGAWIALVFVIAARATGATRRETIAALAGAVAAGAVNVLTDALAHDAGFWWYPEATTPFGPLVYYAEAGLGCGALALFARWLRRRHGVRALAVFVVALAVYAPIRDWATAETTGLVAFDYDPAALVIACDALSSMVIPVLVAYGVLVTAASARPAPR